jgi:phosphoglycerol transferase MdoB-like AlkP superfamily enzyme
MPAHPREWSVKYLSGFIALAAFWATESFLIQASAFDSVPTNLHPVVYQCIRWILDFSVATAVLLFFSRRWLVGLAILDFFLSFAIIPYNLYFHHSMNVEAVRTIGEGFRVLGFALQIVSAKYWVALAAACVIKVVWIYQITPQPACFRRKAFLGCAAVVVIGFLGLQKTSFNLPHFRMQNGNRGVYVYGYLASWTAEFFLAPNMREVAQKLRELQNVSPDRLNAREPSWPLASNVAIVQMESVGWNDLNLNVNGQEVMPYLDTVAKSSRVFCIQAYHNLGSADMDYAVLAGGTPSPIMISYDVPGLTYAHDLPHFMQSHGFHTVSIHGDDGGFFNRRRNFNQMGFDEIWFKEDFTNRPVRMSSWGVRDGDIFKLSSEKMRQARQPEFHFLITLDTHAPFDLIKDDEKEVFPHSKSWQENYFNSLRVLDHVLRDYIESLPEGTMVILYGDHTAGVTYGSYHSSRRGSAEFVPCIVYVCHAHQGWPAQTPQEAVLPADLRVLDVVNVLRHQLGTVSQFTANTRRPY